MLISTLYSFFLNARLFAVFLVGGSGGHTSKGGGGATAVGLEGTRWGDIRRRDNA